MARDTYELVVVFQDDTNIVYYEGASRYNRLINDQIMIRSSEIHIIFRRITSVRPENYIYSENSPVRFQLYRAACVYLVVRGFLPKVEKILLKSCSNWIELDKSVLIPNWGNCRIDVTWPIDVAARCLYETNRAIYVIMTYFLKAQLDHFSHDAFL